MRDACHRWVFKVLSYETIRSLKTPAFIAILYSIGTTLDGSFSRKRHTTAFIVQFPLGETHCLYVSDAQRADFSNRVFQYKPGILSCLNSSPVNEVVKHRMKNSFFSNTWFKCVLCITLITNCFFHIVPWNERFLNSTLCSLACVIFFFPQLLHVDVSILDAASPRLDSALKVCFAPASTEHLLVATSANKIVWLSTKTGHLLREVTLTDLVPLVENFQG